MQNLALKILNKNIFQKKKKKKKKKNHYDRIYMVQDNHRWSMISIILLPYL